MTNLRFQYLFGGIIFGGIAVAVYFFAIKSHFDNGLESIDWIGMIFKIIFVILFGGVSILMLYGFVHNAISDIQNSKIKQYGRNGTGTYLRRSLCGSTKKDSDTYKGQDPHFDIHLSFKNDYGKIIETKTSGTVYSRYAAEALAIKGTFPVKYLNDKVIIIADNQDLLRIFYESKTKKATEKINR